VLRLKITANQPANPTPKTRRNSHFGEWISKAETYNFKSAQGRGQSFSLYSFFQLSFIYLFTLPASISSKNA